ncbi:MAG: hypothetical protein R3Y09_00585 [Clostridia bacterium]
MKRLIAIILIVFLFLVGCQNSEQDLETSSADIIVCETKDHDSVISLFENSSNMTNSFVSEEISFNGNEAIYSAQYVDINNLVIPFSDEKLINTETVNELIFQCTWTPTGESLYIGLVSASNNIYFLELSTGSECGILSLDDLLVDEYEVILYSGCSHDLDGVMNYQLQRK